MPAKKPAADKTADKTEDKSDAKTDKPAEKTSEKEKSKDEAASPAKDASKDDKSASGAKSGSMTTLKFVIGNPVFDTRRADSTTIGNYNGPAGSDIKTPSWPITSGDPTNFVQQSKPKADVKNTAAPVEPTAKPAEAGK